MELELHYVFQVLSLCFATKSTAHCFGSKDAVNEKLFLVPFPAAESPGSQIAQLMLMVAYHPAASHIACKVGRRVLGQENIGSVLSCAKALRVYSGVVSGSFGCVSF